MLRKFWFGHSTCSIRHLVRSSCNFHAKMLDGVGGAFFAARLSFTIIMDTLNEHLIKRIIT